jgi:hypothetical protein
MQAIAQTRGLEFATSKRPQMKWLIFNHFFILFLYQIIIEKKLSLVYNLNRYRGGKDEGYIEPNSFVTI